MVATFSLVALDCPDPSALARFYAALTGWGFRDGEPGPDDTWVQLTSPSGGPTLAFQLIEDGEYRPPSWPGQERPQQLHLDFDVPDLDAGEAEVLALGARKHDVQPSPESFRVYLDPADHPFCLVKA